MHTQKDDAWRLAAIAKRLTFDQQPVRQWMAARCHVGPGSENPTRLHEDYVAWIRALPLVEQPSLSAGYGRTRFIRLLESLGCVRSRWQGGRVIMGLRLRDGGSGAPTW